MPDEATYADSLAELDDSTGRMLAVASTLDDDACRAPSRLPGWSRGHVLAHLARNADGLARLATWATTGVVTPMYASAEARAADIEAGSGRPAEVLLDDLHRSAARLRDQLRAVPGTGLTTVVAMVSGAEASGWEIPLLRIREVELHLVDLDHGVGPADWSERFSTRTLDQIAPGVLGRGGSPVGWLAAPDDRQWVLGDASGGLRGSVQSLLGWLTGRSDGSDLEPSDLPGVPSPPRWG